MSSTAIQEEMLEYFTQLNQEEQLSLLGLIKTFIRSHTMPQRQTLEEYNEELDHAVEEIEAGNFISHEEVMKRISK